MTWKSFLFKLTKQSLIIYLLILLGVITTIEPLDREVMSHHELTVMVRDQGHPSKRSFARVIITTLDHNDHSPQFLAAAFEGQVFETAAAGTAVLQVMAADRDTGTNAEIKYSIISGKSVVS